MRFVFLGSGAFGLPSLDALAGSSHEMAMVVTQPDRPAGRGKRMTGTPVAEWAAGHGIRLIKTENVNEPEILKALREARPDVLVVIAFGQKISEEVLAVAPHGGINLHSSLLPKYRGAAPINWTILNGDAVGGVSVIEVARVMDAGDLFATASTPVGDSETAGELHDRLAVLGAPLLPRVLDEIAAGKAQRLAQDPALVSRAPKLSREMAWVDFSQAAEVVSARIRGLSPWPGVQVEVIDREGKVRTVATVLKCVASAGREAHLPEKCGEVLSDRAVACGRGSIELITLQPAGKKTMHALEFANGYGLVAGARLRSVQKIVERI